jgi:hypothetical protein
MKAGTFVFLLAFCVAAARAQSTAPPSGDVTIGLEEGTSEYCLGPDSSPSNRGPDDITLRFPLKLSYENHRSNTIILPLWIAYLTRMTMAGQNGSTVLRNARTGGMDAKGVMAMSGPDQLFTIIAAGKYVWSTAHEFVSIPVLDRSSGVDLRGKTVQIVMRRDFRSLPPDVVEKLNEKWRDSGTVWTGVAESNTMTLYIPNEPLTRDCMQKLVVQQ